MPTIRVDSSVVPAVSAPITLDALLCAVEPVLGQSGRIVTALRINGVDHPAFREPDVLSRSLVDVDEIDVDTTPVAVMATNALDDALRFLPDLASEAREVAADLRGPVATDHRRSIVGLAENLALLAALVHTADLWARQAGLAGGDWLGDDVAAVERAAAALVTAAGADAWPAVADTLEDDLTVALEGWRARLAVGRVDMEALLPPPTA